MDEPWWFLIVWLAVDLVLLYYLAEAILGGN